MLLSFTQFEREVTAERIRDKIAASKAKDMWMGGNPPLPLLADTRLDIAAGDLPQCMAKAETLAIGVRKKQRGLIRHLVASVRIAPRQIVIMVSGAAFAEALGLPNAGQIPCITLVSSVRLTRTGRAVRLIQNDGSGAVTAPDPTLVKLLLRAQHWWGKLVQGEIDVERLARQEQVTTSYISRIVRLISITG